MKHEKMSRELAKEIREQLDTVLQQANEIFAANGLTATVKNATFNDVAITFKVEFTLGGMSRTDLLTQQAYDYPAFGEKFSHNGKLLEVDSYVRGKFPIICKEVGTANRYKWAAAGVKTLVAKFKAGAY